MNYEQMLSLLRLLLGIGGPVGALLVARGMTQDQVTALSTSLLTIAAALPPIISFGLSLVRHSDAGEIKAVTAMPAVSAIVVKANATDGVAAAVADSAQPKVIGITPALIAEFKTTGVK
jgi:hypothetical protein